MRERKPYPNVSDEELDRRGEEALKRMLANPQKSQGQHVPSGNGNVPGNNSNNNSNNNNRRRHRRRPK